MITREQIEEILDETLEGDTPKDSAPIVVGKEECINRLIELIQNCSTPDVGGSFSSNDMHQAYKDGLNDYQFGDCFDINKSVFYGLENKYDG
jgi:hypothetical protein